MVLAGNIFATKTAIEKAAQNTKTKSHDDKHNKFFFPSEWFALFDLQGFLNLDSEFTVNLQSEPI